MKIFRIVIIGHSHTDCLKKAVENRKLCDGSSNQFEVYRIGSLKMKGIKEALELVKSLNTDDYLILSIGGNRSNAIGLMQHPQPFFLIESNGRNQLDSESNSNHELIPYNAMLSDFDLALSNNAGKVIGKLKNAAKCNVFQLESPPPKEDENLIKENSGKDFEELISSGIGISPAFLRFQLWRIQEVVFRRICEESGVCFISAPILATDNHGFLSKECYPGSNATHANEKYGELVLQQIEEKLIK